MEGGRPETLLDLACGSGSLSLELASRGVDVIGVDGSEDMLSLAMAKAALGNLELMFLEQDMRELDLFGTVSGAGLPAGQSKPHHQYRRLGRGVPSSGPVYRAGRPAGVRRQHPV